MEKNNGKGTVMNDLVPYEPGSTKSTGSMGMLMNAINECLNLKSVIYHKKQALSTIFGFISAPLGENLTLILSEQQDVNGLSFLKTIGELIPDIFKSEFSQLSKMFFIHNPGALKNKTVLALNPAVVKKNSPILKILIECGHVNDQTLGKANGATSINSIRIEGPTSIIVLVGKAEPRWLNGFPALRLVLDSNPNFVTEQLNMRRSRPNQNREKFLQKVIIKELERLKPVPVNISFIDQIVNCLDKNNPKSIIILDTIISLLNVITIINDAVFATPQEAHAGYYDMDMDTITDPEYLLEQKEGSKSDKIEVLEATKVEYYLLFLIVEGIFNLNEDQITGNSRLIFDAIKAFNAGYIFNSTTLESDTATEVEFIKALDNQKDGKGWASILQIKEKIKKDKDIEMPDTAIHRGVNELCERKFITQRKDLVMPNKFLYGVNTLSLDSEFALPKPCTIFDPVYKGHSVEVINPLTGEKEVI